ncbi:Pol protein [Pyrenophora tritici-repentis]|nr:Pol protein [Pyrenophora tritici-repentis]
MQREISDVKRKDTYRTISWKGFNAQDNEILPPIWLFKCKLDNKGYLIKPKDRIRVQGNLLATADDTYAATLATRIFRGLMAIAAYFNLEIWQYDAKAFSDAERLWELRKALCGLKASPLLWYKELTKTLKELGLQEAKEAPCLWRNEKLIVFFYLDDIVVLARPAH